MDARVVQAQRIVFAEVSTKATALLAKLRGNKTTAVSSADNSADNIADNSANDAAPTLRSRR
jgi:hypothetical protein